MALDITALDITVDESTGLTDNDVDKTVAPYSTDPTVQYLLSLDTSGGLSSPEVAYMADFITATATGGDSFSSVSLTQSLSGTPFSTTVGVNSGIQTVDGNYVWLFLDPSNSNVVRGVIGTSNPATAPAAGGALAFSFALINSSTTTPDLYLVQYVALSHPDTNSTDERIDLTNKVFATLSATTTVGFSGANAASGNPDFYIINSPTDASKQVLVIGIGGTANVSTQGFGVANQSINPNETLQVDFVTGGTLASGSASQIQYGSHLEDVTRAGFTINQITPSNPDKRVDITIRAFNNTGNEQGSDFYDGTATNPVDITSVILTGASGFASTITADGTYATSSGNVTITGLSGTGNAVTITGLDNVTTVDFTTATSMDRLQVTGVDANEGCDITEFHFQTTTPNGRTEEVGSFINFDDSGPDLSITAAPVVGALEVVEASNVAGQSQATITPPTYNASAVDGVTPSVAYALALIGSSATGLQTTVGNKAITLVADSASQISGKYDSDNNGSLDATAFTVTLSGTTVTLRSMVALEHSNSPQGAGEDNTLDLNGLIKVVATVSVLDGDNDPASQQSSSSALSITFDDTDPTLSITSAVAVGSAAVDEASGNGGKSTATITPPGVTAGAVDGSTTDVTYALSLAGTATGLVTTAGNHPITLVADSATQISGKYDSDGDTTLDATAFTVVLSGTNVTLTSVVALEHDNTQGGSEDNTLDLSGLINVVATVTVTDGDNDSVSQQSTTSSALSLTFNDTDPVITKAFDADPGTAGNQSPETLANTLNATASGNFGYAMTDQIAGAAYNLTTVSDFVDADANTAGVQISLTGAVSNSQNPGITDAVATLTAEDASSATFSFSFSYDYDPITAGVQSATAGGTLYFDKAADTYTFTLTDVVDGFSFDVLHTAELVAKAPTGNTGHPLIVAEQLTPNGDPDPFFVQFTGNSVTQQIGFGFNSTGDGATVGDTTFNNGGATHDMVTNVNEDWVSATQATNGVAGDTIQKGELLTLRFFEENILSDVNPKAAGGGTERLDPTTSASGVVVKFDGIGNSEDLVLILDLKDANGNEITRAVNVENSDLIRGNANIPAPYNTEFTLDNNDALLIIEQNDYTIAGETYLIQGIQIMQSSNGLTGDAINLNGAVGVNGGSSATTSLTAWDPMDNDVLKIVDIGFVQQNSGTIGASLDFGFNIVDGDNDQTATQHILVDVGDTSSINSSSFAAQLSSLSLKNAGYTADSGMAPSSHSISLMGTSDVYSTLKIEALSHLHTADWYMV
jgi:hypothetical protein